VEVTVASGTTNNHVADGRLWMVRELQY